MVLWAKANYLTSKQTNSNWWCASVWYNILTVYLESNKKVHLFIHSAVAFRECVLFFFSKTEQLTFCGIGVDFKRQAYNKIFLTYRQYWLCVLFFKKKHIYYCTSLSHQVIHKDTHTHSCTRIHSIKQVLTVLHADFFLLPSFICTLQRINSNTTIGRRVQWNKQYFIYQSILSYWKRFFSLAHKCSSSLKYWKKKPIQSKWNKYPHIAKFISAFINENASANGVCECGFFWFQIEILSTNHNN